MRRVILGIFAATFCLHSWAATEPELTVGPKQPDIARRVVQIIEELHYSRPSIDNSLSSAILDRYLDALDGNRLYFLASDVSTFGRYRYELDDLTRAGELQPVFDIFNQFHKRSEERVAYALELLNKEPDFTVDEDFRFDRSKLPWPSTETEAQEAWRKRVKNDALSLMLTGKTWDEAADILRQRYERMEKRVNQITSDDVFETYMNALAHTLDPHSSYLSPRNSEEYRIQMSLSYDGIGASLQLDDDYVTVINVIPGGPAQIDGQLKPQDRITAVGEGKDGDLVDVVGWRLDDVVQLIRGPGGTAVRLQVLGPTALPGAGEHVIELVRDKVKLEEQAAKSSMLDVPLNGHTYKIGVIRVPSFYQDYAARSRGEKDYTSTSRDVARLIGELQKQGLDGLVLDLRQNGGGHLSEATELSGLFINKGPVVQLRQTRGGVEVLDDPSPGEIYHGPLAVLVDRYSASASEIFAAAIQDYKRGVIIGQRTYGKGSVQNLFNLDRFARTPDAGYGQLTLTIGKYYRVTGDSTQNRGVLPDIKLPSAVDASTVGESTRDTALPWDRIAPTNFTAGSTLPAEMPVLRADLTTRTAHDPDFKYLVDDIAAFESTRDRDTISLNMATRKAERDEDLKERLARENARRAALKLEPLASVDDLGKAEPPDVQLEQAGAVVADMAAIGTNVPRELVSGSTAAAKN